MSKKKVLFISSEMTPYLQVTNVGELARRLPQAIQEKNNEGFYPLHEACRYNVPEAVIRLLISLYPEALQQHDNNGWYPLHLACINKVPLPVIQVLVQQWPEAVLRDYLANIEFDRYVWRVMKISFEDGILFS